jgi:hypothetical protein
MKVLLLLATLCVFAGIAGAVGAVDVPPGPATIHLEVVGAGRDVGLPPEDAQFTITNGDDGTHTDTSTFALTTSDGSRCPGVGPLCSGDIQETASAGGTTFVVGTSLGPSDRIPVYSADCNGRRLPGGDTAGGLDLAAGETKTCRVTFVKPDTTAGDAPDAALLLTKTFEADPLGHPDGQLELFLPTDPFSPAATVPLHHLRDGPTSLHECPLIDLSPTCFLAITLGGDIWDPTPPRLDEEIDSDWMPIYGGDCNRSGQLILDPNPDGDLFQCTVDNVHLEAQSGSDRNAIVRLQVDAPGDTSNPLQNAQLTVRKEASSDVTDIGVKAEMRLDDGSHCEGLGPALCTGDVGVAATPAPENFVVEIGSAPGGYTESFSGDCTAAASGDKAVLSIGKGELRTCHVTFTPPPAPPTMLITPASGERNSTLTASSVDPCPSGTSNVALTYIQTDPQGSTFTNALVITPAPDGSWSNTFSPTHTGDVTVDGKCIVVTQNPDGSTTQTDVPYVPGTWTFLAEPPVVTVNLTAPNGGKPDGKTGWFVSGPVTGTVSADDTTTGGSSISSIDCGPVSLQTAGIGTPTASGAFSIAVDGVTDISCTATDSAGNQSSPVTLEVKLDTQAPVVSRNAPDDDCSSPGSNGWCRGTQKAGFSASDSTSGVASPCSGATCKFTQSTSTEGSAVTISSGQVCDVAGNCTAGIDAGPFQIDGTAPTVTRDAAADSCSVPGSAGWCRGTQTAGFSASDSTSGVASPCSGQSCAFTRGTSTESSAVSIASGQVCDAAGNCATSVDAGPFQIDVTAPTLAPTIDPSPVLLHGSATAAPNATDATSGVAGQSCGSIDTGSAGTHSVTCTATDVAGNSTTVQVGYVVEYKILGFFSPVPSSKWKQGQTVPVKFVLADANGAQISDSEAQGLLSPACRVTFNAAGVQTVDDCVRYDTTKHQFIYNWKLGPQTGNETISVSVGYPGTNGSTSLSEPIVITS